MLSTMDTIHFDASNYNTCAISVCIVVLMYFLTKKKKNVADFIIAYNFTFILIYFILFLFDILIYFILRNVIRMTADGSIYSRV